MTTKTEVKKFLNYLSNTWEQVVQNEEKSIDKATELIFDSCKDGGRFIFLDQVTPIW